MATYVMSDLHGAYDALMQMLRTIHFSQDDTLYILGDVVDRGQKGVKILQLVMKTPNIRMLLGNHEDMCQKFFSPDATERMIRHWNRNSNFFTLAGFDKVTDAEKQEILAFIRGLPDEARVTVGGVNYRLIHGFVGETTHEKIWNRPKLQDCSALGENEKLIIGHTPVCEYVCPGSDEEMYVFSRKLTENGDHFRILHADGFTDIDCCVGYGMSAARLACLRLDDGMEFYEKVQE